MRVELIIRKNLKNIFIMQFIIFISIPLIIYTEESPSNIVNEINEDNTGNNGYSNCNIIKYLKGGCKLKLESDEEKYLFKTEIVNMISNGSLSDLIDDVQNGNDIIIREETEIYEIMEMYNQFLYQNITQLDFSRCIFYNIQKNPFLTFQTFLVFKIEHFFTSYRIPIVEYTLFIPGGMFIYCDNVTVDYYIPISGIDNDFLHIYNKSSDYYNDECSQYKSINNTDLTLYTRRNDFNINYLSICETNCTLIDYDPSESKAICECKARDILLTMSELKRNDLIYFFDNEEQASNFYVLNCYFLVSSSDDIKKNPGFYLTVIVLSFFVLIYIFFIFKGYSSLKQRIDEAIRLKFHPNQKEDEKNSKLIIVKINNNKNKNDNQINENRIKKRKKKNSKNNRASKSDVKKLNKMKSNSKSLSLGSRNNMIQIKNEENEKKMHKTNESEKIEEANDENIIIFENDYEINMLSFEEAIKYDKRTCREFYTSLIRTKQLFLFSFLDFNSYNSSILKKTIFFLSFIYHYGFNAFFFTDDVMQKVYEDEGEYNPETLVPCAIYSALCSTVLIRVMVEFLFLTEKNVLNIKNQKTEDLANQEKDKFVKIMCIKFIIFFVINLSLLIFFWFYLTCFNALYLNTRKFLIINTIISFAMSNIFPLIFNIIPAFFRVDVLKTEKQKNAKKKNKTQPKTESEIKDAEYVYNVSQFLQKI